MTIKKTTLAVSIGTTVALTTLASQAEITVLKQDPQAGNPLSCPNFTVGGSIRSQSQNMVGDDGKDGYERNSFDNSTRFRFAVDYYLFDDISWMSCYELDVNFLAMFNWDNHYIDGVNDTMRRILCTGLKSATWGTLTFGQRNSIYYDVVGAKMDIWDYDMVGQAPGSDINGDYDGPYHTRKSLKYKKTVGDVDLYTSYLSSGDYDPNSGPCYKRKGSGLPDVGYHITDDLTWGTVQNYTRTEMHSSTSKTYDQNIVGTALSWKPDNWTFSLGGGWYQNFIAAKKVSVNDYFAGDAQGLGYFAGYTFPVSQYALKSAQPYFMGDHIEYVNGCNYLRTGNGVGISFQLDYGFRVDYEHVFTSSTDNLGDMNPARLCYNF